MSGGEVLDAIPVVSFVFLILTIGVYRVIGLKCPNCGRRKTIESTDEMRPSDVPGIKAEVKWVCRECGETGWSRRASWWSLIP